MLLDDRDCGCSNVVTELGPSSLALDVEGAAELGSGAFFSLLLSLLPPPATRSRPMTSTLTPLRLTLKPNEFSLPAPLAPASLELIPRSCDARMEGGFREPIVGVDRTSREPVKTFLLAFEELDESPSVADGAAVPNNARSRGSAAKDEKARAPSASDTRRRETAAEEVVDSSRSVDDGDTVQMTGIDGFGLCEESFGEAGQAHCRSSVLMRRSRRYDSTACVRDLGIDQLGEPIDGSTMRAGRTSSSLEVDCCCRQTSTVEATVAQASSYELIVASVLPSSSSSSMSRTTKFPPRFASSMI